MVMIEIGVKERVLLPCLVRLYNLLPTIPNHMGQSHAMLLKNVPWGILLENSTRDKSTVAFLTQIPSL